MPDVSAVRQLFGLSRRGQEPSGPAGLQGSFGGLKRRVRPRPVGKLHKAASVGDTGKMMYLLGLRKCLVTDRDKKHRTALHFACAYGHPKVVTLLVKRKCDINACDSENSTALIKAVQWHQEECVTVLLEHGADPNVADASGNTALHYAVCSENTSIAAKLLSHHADTEAKNKDDLTPYLLALRENRQQVAELFIKAETNIHAVDEVERFSSKPGPGDLQPGLDEDDCNFNNKNVPQINLTEHWAAPQQSRKNPKYGIGEPGNRTLLDDTISDRENKDVVKTLSETSLKIQGFSQSSFSSSAPDPKEEAPQAAVKKEGSGTCVFKNASQEQRNVHKGCKDYKSGVVSAPGLGEDDESSPWDSEEEAPQAAVRKEGSGTCVFKNASQEQRNVHKGCKDYKSGVVSAPGLGEDDESSPWDSEEEAPQAAVKKEGSGTCVFKNASQEQRNVHKGCKDYKSGVVSAPGLGEDDESSPWDSEEEAPQAAVKKEGSGTCVFKNASQEQRNVHKGCKDYKSGVVSAPGLGEDDESSPWDSEEEAPQAAVRKEGSGTCVFKNASQEQRNVHKGCKDYKSGVVSAPGLGEDDESSPWDSESIFENLPQKFVDHLSGAADEKGKHTRNIQVEESPEKCLHRKPTIEMKDSVPNKAVAVEDLQTCKSDFSEWNSTSLNLFDKTCQRSANLKDDDKYPLTTQSVTKNLSPSTEFRKTTSIKEPEEEGKRLDGCENSQEQISVSHEDVLHENHRLQNEIARLRLERDAIKNQNQVKEKKYLEDIEIANKKNEDLQRTIKLNEERIFQYNGHLNSLREENTLLHSKLENEKQIKERPETDIESHHSSLAAAVHNYDESQTSKGGVKLDFQRAKEEWAHLQDKLSFDISNLNEMLSQQLSQAGRKFSSLEIELHHLRGTLRENSSVLEQIQRDLKQTQCPMKEIKHMYQVEEEKVNKYMGKQDSIEERLSQVEREIALLREQLDDAHNRVDSTERTLINIQDQFYGIVKALQGESRKQTVMLEDRNKELMDECNHLKERMYQYEKEKAEKELEEENRYTETVQGAEKMQEHLQKLQLENSRLKSKVKKQAWKIEHLQKNLFSANWSEGDKEQLKKLTELTEYLKYTLDEEKKKNAEFQKELTGFKNLLKMTKTELNEQENGDFHFHGDLKSNELDIPISILIHKVDDLAAKLETASSRCLHLDRNSDFLQHELLSMKNIQKKCETLEKNEKKLEEEVVNLRRHIEKNVLEHGQLEQYKQEIEERARRELVEKLSQVNLFLQRQAACQEYVQQLTETSNGSLRSQMELRIADLESVLFQMKTQEESNKILLEKYRQKYLKELARRKSLSSELNNLHRANEQLEEANIRLLVEQQQNRSLLSTVSTRPVLESPCVRNLHHSLVVQRSFLPREETSWFLH